MNLPPKQINILANIKKEFLFGDKIPEGAEIESVTPLVLVLEDPQLAAADEEKRVKARTKRLEPKGSKASCFYSMRHARARGMSYQRFRSQDLQRTARCK